MSLEVTPEEENQRLDRFLCQRHPELSRNRIKDLIEKEAVLVNGSRSRPSYQTRRGDQVQLTVPDPVPLEVKAEKIPIDIVYEDQDLLVVNKGANMSVHPAPGSWEGTLVNALLDYCRDLSGINGVLRPGIVHRLDKHTTGLLVVAKRDSAHRHLADQLKAHRIQRRYSALVWGRPDEERGWVDAPIGRNSRERRKMAVNPAGRPAMTHFRVARRFEFTALLDLRLETGRTHQIRVHLQHRGHPVFGEPSYAGRNQLRGILPRHRDRARHMLALIERQALHARELSFVHPSSGEYVEFKAPLPEDFTEVLAAAGQGQA